jgi:2-polyprenyl-6-methoxyphenol hydroxylase-like FAD-dependent oxidoreductase
MLLARAGLRVLVIDRARFPSDTISGHMIKPAGVAYLKRWGLLDSLLATGCPPIRGRRVQFGDCDLALPDPPPGSLPPLAPRRLVLDPLLLDAARQAGAAVWEGASLRELIWRNGRVAGARIVDSHRRESEFSSHLVIGADGRNSLVARLAGAQRYGLIETVSIAYYAYWNGFTTQQIEVYFQPGRMVGLFPTHHQQTLIFVQWPAGERARFKSDIEGNYLATLRSIAAVAKRLDQAERSTRILGMIELPNFFRQPTGPGWALVGDAGHHKDPLVARGISDAWRDSQLLTDAVIGGWGDTHDLRLRLADYHRMRDRTSHQLTRLNANLARLDRPLAELSELWLQLAEAERASDELLLTAATVRESSPISCPLRALHSVAEVSRRCTTVGRR